jgi:hypothetical protein
MNGRHIHRDDFNSTFQRSRIDIRHLLAASGTSTLQSDHLRFTSSLQPHHDVNAGAFLAPPSDSSRRRDGQEQMLHCAGSAARNALAQDAGHAA